MMSESEVIGMKELEEALRSLAPMIVGKKGYPKNALRNASRAMANKTVSEAKARAPVKSGRLRDSITKKPLALKYRDMATLGGNSKEYYYIGHKAGKDRDDLSGAWYGTPVEGGHYTKKNKQGTWVPPQPHLVPAVDENRGKLPNIFAEKIRKDLLRIAKKIGDENRRKILSKVAKI